jgi:MSHA biogenesis protein MshJ
MKAYWQLISTKFQAHSPRERCWRAGGILILLIAISNMLLVSPLVHRNEMLQTELAADQSRMQTVHQQIAVLTQQKAIDPDAENKQRLTALLARLKLQNTQLKELQAALVHPEDVPNLLRRLLARNSQVKLISLKTLPAEGLLENDTSASKNAQKNTMPADVADSKPSVHDDPVYKHDVEITIEGRYLDLLGYVAELETMPWHLLWASAVLKVNEDDTSPQPLSQLKLTVYTLSLDPTWLSI